MRSFALPILLAAILLASFGRSDTSPPAISPSQIAITISRRADCLTELNTYLSRGWTVVSTVGVDDAYRDISAVVILTPPAPRQVLSTVYSSSANTVTILPYEQRLAAIKHLHDMIWHTTDFSPELIAQSFTPISPSP